MSLTSVVLPVAPLYAGIGPSKVKVPAEYIMTDGCGLANGDFFAALADALRSEWYIHTTTVQVRINGSKVGSLVNIENIH